MFLLVPKSPGYPWSSCTSWSTTQHQGPADLLGPLVHGPGPHFPCPRYPWSTHSLSWLSQILAFTLLSYLEPSSHTPSTLGPLPPSAQSHLGLSRSSTSLCFFDFNHLLFRSSPPPFNLILSLLLHLFLRLFLVRSVSPLVFAHDLMSILFPYGLPLHLPWHDPDCSGSTSALS